MKLLALLLLSVSFMSAEAAKPKGAGASTEKSLDKLEKVVASQKKQIDALATDKPAEPAKPADPVPFAPAKQQKARMLTPEEKKAWQDINDQWELFARRTCETLDGVPYKRCGITSIAVFENADPVKIVPDVKAEAKPAESKK